MPDHRLDEGPRPRSDHRASGRQDMDVGEASRKRLNATAVAGKVKRMSRYRATLFDRQRTRWRATRDEALSDAVARGWASRDDYDRAPTYLGIGVKIEEAPDTKKRRTP